MFLDSVPGLAQGQRTHQGNQAYIPGLNLAPLAGSLSATPAQSRTKSKAKHGGGSNECCGFHPKCGAGASLLAIGQGDAFQAVPRRAAGDGAAKQNVLAYSYGDDFV